MSALLRSCRGVFRSHALLQPCVRQCRRSAFTLPKDPTLNALIWVGVGMTGVTSFLVYKSATSPKHSTGMSGHRVKQYSNSGAVHPEAQTEKLMVEKVVTPTKEDPTHSPPPATPPATSATDAPPIEAPPTKTPPAEAPPIETPPTEIPPMETPPTQAPPTPEVPQSVAEPTAASADQVPRLPEHVPYVLIGAGTASFAAAKAILEKDPAAKILIVGEEGFTPYSRPPLSKQLWFNEDHEAARQLKYQAAWAGGKVVDAFYKMDFCDPNDLATKTEGGVAVLRGKKAVSLDPAQKKVVLDDGVSISYGKLLLATGGTPKNLSLFTSAPDQAKAKTSVYRNIPDYLALDDLVGRVESIVIVGGGFLGSELAVAMASRGKPRGLKVTQVFPEDGNLGLILPTTLCKWTTAKVRKEGVEVLPNTVLKGVALEGEKVKLTTQDDREITADHVVVAVGLTPNTSLAESAHLETDPTLGGYLVNAELQACSDVWAAGDVACFYDPQLGRRRVEHHDHAFVSGGLAGRNMAGDHQHFKHQSMFWSDIGKEVGFEATGLVDSRLPTVSLFAKIGEDAALPSEDFSKGVVFYLSENSRRVVGVLTWNIFGKMDLAREIITEKKTEADIGQLASKFEIQ
ncbi:hypothetical protein EMCRGX_G033268 [Ephydatia muelleri]